MKKISFILVLAFLSLSLFAETIPENRLGQSLSCGKFIRQNTFTTIHNQNYFSLTEKGRLIKNIPIKEIVLHGDILCIYGDKNNTEYALYFDLMDSNFFAVDKRNAGAEKWNEVILCEQPVYDPPFFF